jgi:hypothetical protein
VRIGLTPLILSIVVVAVRLKGAHASADLLAYIYLTVITLRLTRTSGLSVAQRA